MNLEVKRQNSEKQIMLAESSNATRLAKEREQLLLLAQDDQPPKISARIVSFKGAAAVIEGTIDDVNIITFISIDDEPYNSNDQHSFKKRFTYLRQANQLSLPLLMKLVT